MADNVQLSQGPLIVATKGDAANVQHQEVVAEFMAGVSPVQVATGAPLPTYDDVQTELLTSILVEMRVLTTLLYSLSWTEVETLEDLRALFKTYPVTP